MIPAGVEAAGGLQSKDAELDTPAFKTVTRQAAPKGYGCAAPKRPWAPRRASACCTRSIWSWVRISERACALGRRHVEFPAWPRFGKLQPAIPACKGASHRAHGAQRPTIERMRVEKRMTATESSAPDDPAPLGGKPPPSPKPKVFGARDGDGDGVRAAQCRNSRYSCPTRYQHSAVVQHTTCPAKKKTTLQARPLRPPCKKFDSTDLLWRVRDAARRGRAVRPRPARGA